MNDAVKGILITMVLVAASLVGVFISTLVHAQVVPQWVSEKELVVEWEGELYQLAPVERRFERTDKPEANK